MKKGRLITFLIALSALVVMFQNMTLSKFNELGIADVDHETRRTQSIELLGSYYRGSIAQKLEKRPYLNYLIYKRVQEGLDPKWHSHVPSLVQEVILESKKFGFDPVFVLAVIQTESRFNPLARGYHGEIGLMQILPNTAAWVAQKHGMAFHGEASLQDPVTNVKIGIRYLAMLRRSFEKDANDYVAAYNMGPSNLRKIASVTDPEDGPVPLRQYPTRVMKNYYALYEKMSVEHVELDRMASNDKHNTSGFLRGYQIPTF